MAKSTETPPDPDMLAGMDALIVAIKQPRVAPSSSMTDSVTRPTTAGEPIDAVEQARAYDTLFRRAAEPRQLGRYVVLDSLGQGGMGVVLRAYDRELDRTVALKVLHRGLDESHTRRLRREAQAMAKLSHPNVVQVYEVGEVEGQTFVAMELVKGKTLREWMQQRPRPSWKACVELFVQLGAGLAAAHERGLVHRDFKPGNAIVDEKGRARVLDFGLARRDDQVDEVPSVMLEKARTDSHATVPLEASLTDTGTVLGTPAYMPPEQMGGRGADARSDQFSFCVSLYEIQPCGSQPRGTTRQGEIKTKIMSRVRKAGAVILTTFTLALAAGGIVATLYTAEIRTATLGPTPALQRWDSVRAQQQSLAELRKTNWKAIDDFCMPTIDCVATHEVSVNFKLIVMTMRQCWPLP